MMLQMNQDPSCRCDFELLKCEALLSFEVAQVSLMGPLLLFLLCFKLVVFSVMPNINHSPQIGSMLIFCFHELVCEQEDM